MNDTVTIIQKWFMCFILTGNTDTIHVFNIFNLPTKLDLCFFL